MLSLSKKTVWYFTLIQTVMLTGCGRIYAEDHYTDMAPTYQSAGRDALMSTCPQSQVQYEDVDR